MSSEALQRWQLKLNRLLEAEAIETDTSVRFRQEVEIAEARTKIAELEGERGTSPTRATLHVEVGRILQYAPARLIGREEDMGVLVDAWAQASAVILGRPRIVSFVALGGEGKTALVAKWLTDLASADWSGAAAVFAWSFYSQGAKDWSAASSDLFLSEALTFFGDPGTANSSKHAVEKAKRLVHLLRERRALLVLDGLEPLQYPPSSPMRGRLKDQAMAMLLKGLAAQSSGLCVLTTRYAVTDLEGAGSNVQNHPIKRLSTAAGVALLKALGVQGRVGELQAAVEDVRGHALTLNLLGRYLRDAYAGDVRRRDQVQFEEADAEEQGGHAFRVMDQYVAWFETDEAGRQAIALLRLMGLFDRPAAVPVFASLLAEPGIAGLTESVVGVSETRCNVALARLEAAQLLTVEREGQTPVSYDAHPLVREYFARRLQETRGVAWRAGHCRLFDHLRTSVEHRPATLEGLQPLYQAVVHGCLGGLHQVACTEVYIDRILRGTGYADGFYSTTSLGAFGADLGAVAYFFDLPWRKPSSTFRPAFHPWLISQAAACLRALGRLQEALEPMRAGLELDVAIEAWKSAVAASSNLAELTLTLGEVADALAVAERAMLYAEWSGDRFMQIRMRAHLADAQHQAGRPEGAAEFRAAEAMQAKLQPDYPLLYTLPGYVYCDLLLAAPERAAWRRAMGTKVNVDRAALSTCHGVKKRAQKTLRWGERTAWPFDIALNRLCLGRAAIYRVVLDGAVPNQTVRAHLDAAVENLRRAGQQDYLPRGLLSRALLRAVDGHLTGHDSAQEDLDEAWDIAEPGPMRLHMADVHLHRARLFASATPYPWDSPEADLRAARTLIERCGYNRRLEELADAEAHLLKAP